MPDDSTPVEDGPSEEFAFSDRIPKGERPTKPPPEPETTPDTDPEPEIVTEPDTVTEPDADVGAEPEEAEREVSVDTATEVSDVSSDVEDIAAEPPTEVLDDREKPERTRPPLVPILAVLTGLLLVTTVLFGLMAFAPRFAPIKSSAAKLAVRAQEEDGLKNIARRFAENFVSINYKTIDEDLDEMTADATSDFATKLRDTVERIEKAFVSRKASSEGTALDAAVLSHTDDSAIVQVLLRRTKTNVGTKGPETGNQIVNVTLVETPDGWKVSDLSQLGSDAG